MDAPRDILTPLGITRRVLPCIIGMRTGARDQVDEHHVAISLPRLPCLEDPPGRWSDLDRYIADRRLAAGPGR